MDQDTGKKTKEQIVLSIEETQRKDDLGKWFLISKKENLDWVQKVIDKYLIPTAKSRMAYNNHVNDNESFKLGVRRTNRTNTTMENYAEALRETFKTGPGDTNDKYDKYDYTKNNKRKTIQIEYDTDFPEIKQTSKKNTQKQTTTQQTAAAVKQKQNNSGNNTTTTQATSSGSVGSNESLDTVFKNAMEATTEMIKLQLDAFKQQFENMAREQEKWRQETERKFQEMKYFVNYNHDAKILGDTHELTRMDETGDGNNDDASGKAATPVQHERDDGYDQRLEKMNRKIDATSRKFNAKQDKTDAKVDDLRNDFADFKDELRAMVFQLTNQTQCSNTGGLKRAAPDFLEQPQATNELSDEQLIMAMDECENNYGYSTQGNVQGPMGATLHAAVSPQFNE